MPSRDGNIFMFKKLQWYAGWFRYLWFQKVNKGKEAYAGRYLKRTYLDHQKANDYICDLIRKGDPFLVCRLGTGEAFAMRTYEFGHKKNKNKALKQICDCAGFFPCEEEYAMRFLDCMKDAMTMADGFGTALVPLDYYFVKKKLPKQSVTMNIAGMIPIGVESPWSSLLKGRKVLVVHPFSATIRKQYDENREKLFPGLDILPQFELICYKAVQTSAGEVDERFQTWFEALSFMESEIEKIEYDIALLGCGAYGMPLAAWMKEQGKMTIHIGGALQTLFGIKGKRWDENGTSAMYNEYWCYPSDEETPKGNGMIEGGCYWK